MQDIKETEISRTIINAYHEKLVKSLVSDVIIVGSGPSGLTAAYYLAREGLQVTLIEKLLSPGGGIWGGGMGMNEAVVQEDAADVLVEFGIKPSNLPGLGELIAVDTIEFASALCLKAIQAGAALFNLMTAEDISIHNNRVTGIVANRSLIGDSLPVDPITFSAKAVLDATGHDAVLVDKIRKRDIPMSTARPLYHGEGAMNAQEGETFVVENTTEIYPGLWISGMSVCATFGGPRMGPIFGGMLLSGKRAAEQIASALRRKAQRKTTNK